MRSDYVFSALTNVPSRYLLCQVTARAARKLHVPATRMEETINRALTGIAFDGYSGAPVKVSLSAPVATRVEHFALYGTQPPTFTHAGEEDYTSSEIALDRDFEMDQQFYPAFDDLVESQAGIG